MKTFVVTGASGFIGRYVLDEMSRRECRITVVTRNASRLSFVGPDVRVVERDLAVATDGFFKEAGSPDTLIHLAWDGLPNYDSLHHFEHELPVHYRFIRNMVVSGLNSVVVTGTCFEYGRQYGPLREHQHTRPSNAYGHAKDALRCQLEFLKSCYSFQLVWARLFYMYGEGQPPGTLYSQLWNAVTKGDRVFNMSGGEQLRDYLHVKEVAKLLVDLAFCDGDVGVINLCSGTPISIRHLVESWLRMNNWDIELNLGYYPYSSHEPMAFWGDSSYLNEILKHP